MTMIEERPVIAALVGLGWWGKKMASLVNSGGAEMHFVRGIDPNPETETFAKEAGLQFSTDLAEALADPNIEAVVLATPHSLHQQQIAQVVAAGKHVFCEKPLDLTRAGAEASVALCRRAGVVLGMGHERRFEPPIAEILTAAGEGRLGRLLQIEANFSHDKFLGLDPSNWRLKADQAPAGGMTATGIHLTDLAVKLMGPAKDVRVICENLASQIPQGDTMSAHIRFGNGGSAYVSATLATPFVSRFAVYGTLGWIEVRDKAHVEAPDGWVVTEGWKDKPITVREVAPAEPVRDNLRAFARAVRGQKDYPITGEDMINNIALLEAIVRSARTGALEQV
ncbi:Gfo/Idh/MocA family oxidoreductase [Rhizobium sp. P32RR-XVIII]|uniref:Gfo/Idh/MocA family protein n=1 Tax=Rhizobium sp. P32RR-XVIII TaxID=2726738 RepID=UPI0014571800|nr:Gfo/Idh/MocA family oxidoreductase [Rhizobium sp. P32RR-XVIII]NLS02965.1 Gfo/Idh/MocA family oxidoreductase [Rhizobium sp. P32RR-XVIII]